MATPTIQINQHSEGERGIAGRNNTQYHDLDWYKVLIQDGTRRGEFSYLTLTVYRQHDGAYISDDDGRIVITGLYRHYRWDSYRMEIQGKGGGEVLAFYLREKYRLKLAELKAA